MKDFFLSLAKAGRIEKVPGKHGSRSAWRKTRSAKVSAQAELLAECLNSERERSEPRRTGGREARRPSPARSGPRGVNGDRGEDWCGKEPIVRRRIDVQVTTNAT